MMGIRREGWRQQRPWRSWKKQEVEVVQIPDQMDPDEYLNKNSPQALADLLEKKHVSVA